MNAGLKYSAPGQITIKIKTGGIQWRKLSLSRLKSDEHAIIYCVGHIHPGGTGARVGTSV